MDGVAVFLFRQHPRPWTAKQHQEAISFRARDRPVASDGTSGAARTSRADNALNAVN